MTKPKVSVDEFKALSLNKGVSVKSNTAMSLDDVFRQYGTASFSQNAAMRIGTFAACVTDKIETVGQLPVKLYRKVKQGRELVESGRIHRIFTQEPNDFMTMTDFMEMMVASLETNGAFYAYPVFNDRGLLSELIPFRNQGSIVPSMDVAGRVYYTYVTNDGKPNMSFYKSSLFIVNKFTFDGFTPIRPLSLYATRLGIAQTQEENYVELQKNGITTQMGLSTDGTFNDPNAADRLRADMKELRGPKGFNFIPIFEQGLKPVNLKLTPQEAELFNNRTLTDEHICSMTGVPMHRINMNSTTKADVNSMDEFYMRSKINPILVKFEQAINAFVPDDYEVVMDRMAFYAGSPWRLVEAVEKALKGGMIHVNESRGIIGFDPVDGGDVFAIDNNNVTYGTWNELPSVREQIYGRTTNGGQTNEN